MAPKSFILTPELHDYLMTRGTQPDAVQSALIERTAELGGVSGMQIAPEQGAFMEMLTRLIGAREAVEVGTFTGYSALSIARGLPDDGHLLCCDVSEEWTSIGRAAWVEAGVSGRIELRIGPGAETLRSLPLEPRFDLAFIDADKPAYPVYFEEILLRLRPNGVILVDNTLQGGQVLGADDHGGNVAAMRAFNDAVAADDRVDVVMLPVADGLTLARKR